MIAPLELCHPLWGEKQAQLSSPVCEAVCENPSKICQNVENRPKRGIGKTIDISNLLKMRRL